MKTRVAIEIIDPTKKCLRSGKPPNIVFKLPDLSFGHETDQELVERIRKAVNGFKSVNDLLLLSTEDTQEVMITAVKENDDSRTVFLPVAQIDEMADRFSDFSEL